MKSKSIIIDRLTHFYHNKFNSMLPIIRVPQSMSLPDKGVWRYRFNIPSETTDRLYKVAQHKEKKYWGCSCPGWKKHRHCKHLRNIGLPGDEKPYEVNFIKE